MERLKVMMDIQDSLNELTTTDWKNANLAWNRALWLEAAEAVESCPWKWWKKGSLDIKNILIEVIDMWHFGLSIAILESSLTVTQIEEIVLKSFADNSSGQELDEKSIITQIEGVARAAIMFESPASILSMLASVAAACGMSYTELTKLYIGKSVLNKFRQENGYKDGTYIKMWGDYEDNVTMQTKISEIELNDSFIAELEIFLTDTYEDIKPV